MRFDPNEPQNPYNDRFVLSKGHAAPILYAAWAEAGLFPRSELLKLRADRLRSRRPSDAAAVIRRRGHRIARPGDLRRDRHRPSTRAASVPTTAPTCCSATARWPRARSGKRPAPRSTIGSTTSARSSTSTRSARARPPSSATTRRRSPTAGRPSAGTPSRLTVTTSSSCSPPTRRRVSTSGRPTMIVARTLKGKGVSFTEGKEAGTARRLKKEEADSAVAELAAADDRRRVAARDPASRRSQGHPPASPADYSKMPAPAYKLGDLVATREAWGTGLAALGGCRPPGRRARRRREELDLQRPLREGPSGSVLRVLYRRAGHGRRRHGARGPRRDSVPFDLRLLPHAGGRLHPHGRHLRGQRQAGRLARRHLDR